MVGTFPGFLKILFEKQQEAPSRFSTEFCVNPRKAVTNRNRGMHFPGFKRVNSKAVGVTRLRTFQLKIKLKEELKNSE